MAVKQKGINARRLADVGKWSLTEQTRYDQKIVVIWGRSGNDDGGVGDFRSWDLV